MKTTMTAARQLRAAVFCACALAFAACTPGATQEFMSVSPALTVKSSRSVAVAVQDHRPYILADDRLPIYTGLQRNAGGRPSDVVTESRLPLATEFALVISGALRQNGIVVKTIDIKPTDSARTVAQALLAAGMERQILLQMKEWKTDTYQSTALLYDLHLSVRDRNGNLLGEAARKGDENLGSGDFFDPPAHAESAAQARLKVLLEELLNDPKIVQVLQ